MIMIIIKIIIKVKINNDIQRLKKNIKIKTIEKEAIRDSSSVCCNKSNFPDASGVISLK